LCEVEDGLTAIPLVLELEDPAKEPCEEKDADRDGDGRAVGK
jgi:hypothetical protein